MIPKERVQQAAKVILARNQNLEKMHGLKMINLSEIMLISLGFAELLANEKEAFPKPFPSCNSFCSSSSSSSHKSFMRGFHVTQKTCQDFHCVGNGANLWSLVGTHQNPCRVQQREKRKKEPSGSLILLNVFSGRCSFRSKTKR